MVRCTRFSFSTTKSLSRCIVFACASMRIAERRNIRCALPSSCNRADRVALLVIVRKETVAEINLFNWFLAEGNRISAPYESNPNSERTSYSISFDRNAFGSFNCRVNSVFKQCMMYVKDVGRVREFFSERALRNYWKSPILFGKNYFCTQ